MINYTEFDLLPPPLNLLLFAGRVVYAGVKQCLPRPREYQAVSETDAPATDVSEPRMPNDLGIGPLKHDEFAPNRNEGWARRYRLEWPEGEASGASEPQDLGHGRDGRLNMVDAVMSFLTENEHSEVLEERWRKGFSGALGALDRKVVKGVSGIGRKLDERSDGVDEKLAELLALLKQGSAPRKGGPTPASAALATPPPAPPPAAAPAAAPPGGWSA